MMDLILFAQRGGGGMAGIATACCMLVPLIAGLAGLWKTFEKAGQPGWAAIIPFYNAWILVQISGKESWWFFLFFVPIANIIAPFVISIALAEKFGKGTGFGIGLALLGFIFYPLLGFGDAKYQSGPRAQTADV